VARPTGRHQQQVLAVAGGPRRPPAPQLKWWQGTPAAAPEPQPKKPWQGALKPKPETAKPALSKSQQEKQDVLIVSLTLMGVCLFFLLFWSFYMHSNEPWDFIPSRIGFTLFGLMSICVYMAPDME
jgi:hypothetical protein